MCSIWDTPAWQSLGGFCTTPGNLTFSYYIDWFNPYLNKIAGKHASCGAIVLFCLNLPDEMQRLPENVFFSGITPPPKELNVDSETIDALVEPIVARLQCAFDDGLEVPTFLHPEGTDIHVGVFPLIGDLLAIRKAIGFAGVGARHLCHCHLKKDEIDSLYWQTWRWREKADVKASEGDEMN